MREQKPYAFSEIIVRDAHRYLLSWWKRDSFEQIPHATYVMKN